ncbi:MAG: DUF2834 domain-containing protein [Myxococcales bacterium]|nr:DUF2834 domain-containing protein [Myxococcales bacterium]
MKRFAWLAALVAFIALTVAAIVGAGWSGFIAWMLQSPLWFAQVAADLVVSLSLVLAWIVLDARQRGIAAWPWVVLTLCTGSIGPLLYLALRAGAGDAVAAITQPTRLRA